ncbi:hypothetical protein C8J57DRAFT_1710212 [Mycena rebaudengoi]|nr:hypothetical protein C8J57DRAFT_1710212 [Mycena rebaudengoi]
MLRTLPALLTNISTPPAKASRASSASKSTRNSSSRPLEVNELPPSLLNVPFTPSESQSRPEILTCSASKPLGLGIIGLDFPIFSLPLIEKRPADPEFNSLYDLDVQYPSSRSLNAPSPDSVLDFTYSPPNLSPSWSLESMFSSSFSTPSSDLAPRPSSVGHLLPASWSSSSACSTSSNSFFIKTEPDAQTPLLLIGTPDMTVPIADINMFHSAERLGVSAGINPAHITAPLDRIPLSQNPPSPCDAMRTDDVFGMIGSTHYNTNGFFKALLTASPRPSNPDVDISGDYAPTPILSDRSNSQPPRPRIIKRKSSTQDVSPLQPQPQPRLRVKNEEECTVDLGTPVLDAHHGITQVELGAKALRYQQRNPTVLDLDKRWLASFAGKLSVHGQLLDDYRCYVVGCTQVNKRKDHMIVHVGSHLDHRPYKCGYCPSRFIRNNERKRHEQGHIENRRFVCSQCPSAFGRLDLLNRHLKNQHQMEREKPRKKAKIDPLD